VAGVKGRSGRKSLNKEEKRLRVIDRAWDIIEANLNSNNLSLKEKGKIALELCKKNIPLELEGEGLKLYVQVINYNGKENPSAGGGFPTSRLAAQDITKV